MSNTIQQAAAEAGDVKGHTFDVTFTKWITNYPIMAGIVGGDVGVGLYAGEVLHLGPTVNGITEIHALYHFNGSEHSFTADLHVTQNDNTTPGTAALKGVITQGWLKGAPVTGEYTVELVCPIPTPGIGPNDTTCYQGSLHIQYPSEQ